MDTDTNTGPPRCPCGAPTVPHDGQRWCLRSGEGLGAVCGAFDPEVRQAKRRAIEQVRRDFSRTLDNESTRGWLSWLLDLYHCPEDAPWCCPDCYGVGHCSCPPTPEPTCGWCGHIEANCECEPECGGCWRPEDQCECEEVG